MLVEIVSRRNLERNLEHVRKLHGPDAVIIDVTSHSDSEIYIKFSPFFPHRAIPVSGMIDTTTKSVEGGWQGLKIFSKETVDLKKFEIVNMRKLKRAPGKKRGDVIGHSYGEEILDYVTARKMIYVPMYEYVLDNYLTHEMEMLRNILYEKKLLILVDYETNEDVEDTKKPLSHASIIKRRLLEIK